MAGLPEPSHIAVGVFLLTAAIVILDGWGLLRAHRDTDDDGLPDSIVTGCETNLDADDDDDDDGVPDSEDLDPTDASKGRASEEAEERSLFATIFSPGGVLTAGVVIVFTVFAFLRSRAGEDEF